WKELKKIKHLNRDQLFLKNSIERNALGNFQKVKAHLKSNLMNTGMPQLAELLEKKEIKISIVEIEAPESNSSDRAAVSHILQRKHKEASEGSIFFLTPEFFQPAFTTISTDYSPSGK